MVQWYPGHIAKAERDLKDQLKAVDIVLEVGATLMCGMLLLLAVHARAERQSAVATPLWRAALRRWLPGRLRYLLDGPHLRLRPAAHQVQACQLPCRLCMLCCPSPTTPAATQLPALPPLPAAPVQVRDGRIPMSTRHPHIPEWIGSKPRVLLINRKDMVPEADRAAWSRFFAERGHSVQWTHGNQGDGVAKVRCGEGAGCLQPAAGLAVLQQPGRLRLHSVCCS